MKNNDPKISSWKEFEEWCKKFENTGNRYIFRGQGDAEWKVETSLARFFRENNVASDEWRIRETIMYRAFRESLLKKHTNCNLYEPIKILALMQHYGGPTRLLDFTYSPMIAAYFALKQSMGTDSSIWVIDTDVMNEKNKINRMPGYFGPKHDSNNNYFKEKKIYEDRNDNFIIVIGNDLTYNDDINKRIICQQGCFVNTNRISREISSNIFVEKITLLKNIRFEDCFKLEEDNKYFPEPDIKEHICFRARRESILDSKESFKEK